MKIFALFSVLAIAHLSACSQQPPKISSTAPRFSVVASGERFVKLDADSGKTWILEPQSSQWRLITDQPTGKYNPATGKIEWDAASNPQMPSPKTVTDPEEIMRIFAKPTKTKTTETAQ